MKKIPKTFKFDHHYTCRFDQRAYSLESGTNVETNPLNYGIGQKVFVDITDQYCPQCTKDYYYDSDKFCGGCGTKLIEEIMLCKQAIIVAISPGFNEYVTAWNLVVVLKEPHEFKDCPFCGKQAWVDHQVPLRQPINSNTVSSPEEAPASELSNQDLQRCLHCGWLRY